MADGSRKTAAVEYTSRYGWYLVQIQPKKKFPTGKAWQNTATSDPEVAASRWEGRPDHNIGLLLGPKSGVIDVECDGEGAEEKLLELFDGEIPACPTWSSSRGKHRLFKWSDRLPVQDKNNFKIGNLEFRTGNGGMAAQSVMPPSVHPSGEQYKWDITPEDAEPPEIPSSVLVKIINELGDKASGNGKAYEEVVEGGVSEGNRNNSMASLIGKRLHNMVELSADAVGAELQFALVMNSQNSPPLPENEVRAIFKSILKREQTRRANDEYGDMFEPDPSQVIEATGKSTVESKTPLGQVRLVKVRSDPPTYELHSNAFSYSGGLVTLDVDDMFSALRVRKRILTQADFSLTSGFNKRWPDLCNKLLRCADERDAEPEEKRYMLVAHAFLDLLVTSSIEFPAEKGDCDPGVIYRRDDGSFVFMFSYVLNTLAGRAEKVTHGELSALLKKLGCTYENIIRHTTKWKVLDKDGYSKLREME